MEAEPESIEIEWAEPDEEREERERLALGAARNSLLLHAANVFQRLNWRVRTTADLREDGELVLRAEPSSIQGYSRSIGFSRERLLGADHEIIEYEISVLPRAMIQDIFGSELAHLVWLTPSG